MYKLLCPQLVLNALSDINLEELEKIGIKGIIFDLDNTIIPWDQPAMQPDIIQWLKGLAARGFKIGLVSNNRHQRVKEIAAQFAIPFAARAYKPAKTGFRQVASQMELTSNQVAVVGDQLFTDILGGNRLGLYTIWVAPLSSKEFIGTKITRQLEKLTVRILRSKGMLKTHQPRCR
ncbi:MAG: YqeG family HAD IIIA-type phosphatase [Veillonellales bacterium]